MVIIPLWSPKGSESGVEIGNRRRIFFFRFQVESQTGSWVGVAVGSRIFSSVGVGVE